MFYKIDFNQKKDVLLIVWNTIMSYIIATIAMGGIFFALTNRFYLGLIFLIMLFSLLMYYLYKYGDLIKNLRVLEKEKKLDYEGSKYSFKEPLTIKIPKKLLKKAGM